jgi:16S rRNA (cytidine1402-2'-O)-methyltransferase
VRACAEAGETVEVVPGPSAALAGLAVSGLPTQRFVFEGFLPRRGSARRDRLADLAREPRTIVCFESPHHLAETLGDLSESCGADRRVVIARELTKLHEEVFRGTLAEAVVHARSREPRGEHVIVLAGAPPHGEATDEDVDAEARTALEAGLSAKDAAAQVAARLGIARRRAYDAVIARRANP